MDRRGFVRLLAVAGLAACTPSTGDPADPTGAAAGGTTPPIPRPGGRTPTTGAAAPATPQPPDAAQATGPVAVPLLCRAAWGAAPPSAGGRPHTVTAVMIHHSGVVLDDNRRAPRRLALYQRDHQGRGWPDIAYHVAVDGGGNVYELRDPAIAGDTATDFDPARWLNVVLDGNFDVQDPPPAQLESLAAVVAWATARFGTAPQAVATHRDHVPTTACPGAALHERVAGGVLAARVGALLAAGGVTLEPWCGQRGAERVAAIEAGRA